MLQHPTPRLILASASGARRALLAGAGLTFAAEPANIGEDQIKRGAQADGVEVVDAALLLAEMKARRVGRRQPDALVVGADQILVCDGQWFDKPDGPVAADQQLRALRGKTHMLVTAVVCHRDGSPIWQHVARPKLTMRQFSEAFLEAYLAAEGSHVTESVGAYRLEGPGVHLFDRIEGEHAAILGLPLLPLLGFLRQHGVLLA